MQAYELKTVEFTGPLDKLLELIEGKELEITKINLAEVTADFVNYIKTIQDIQPKLLADFVEIASKLILIKSHTLLPSLELSKNEEEDMKELEDRLRLYKEFKLAEKNIKSMWAKKVSYGREYLLATETQFLPGQAIMPKALRDIVEKIAEELTVIFPKMETGNIKLINFEEKMKELMERVSRTALSSFREISKGRDRTEIVVLFLAILHLLKDSLIRIEQAGEFEDIKLSTNNESNTNIRINGK